MSLVGVAVLAGWIIVVTGAFNVLLAHRLNGQADVVLRTRAVTAAATVDLTPSGIAVRESDGDGQLDSGIWVYAAGRRITAPSGRNASLDRFTATLARGDDRYVVRGDDRFYVRAVHRKGRRVATVVASVSDVPYERAEVEALVGSSVVVLLVLAGSYPVLRFAAGRALRPVTRMTRQAEEWSVHGLDERFTAQQPYQEVQALASTLNHVLDTLAAIVRHERQLSAELSHELRTPLARIIAETDLLLARPKRAEEVAAAHEAVRDSAGTMGTILETLLSAAREEVRVAPGRSVIDDVVAPMARRVRQSQSRAVTVGIPPRLTAGVDAAVVERILAPVLDNAVRYAASEVRIVAGYDAGTVFIDVVDDGPGVPPEQREVVFEPGRRGDPHDGHDGAGLGLALARRLARAAAGDVEIVGAHPRFRISLPPA